MSPQGPKSWQILMGFTDPVNRILQRQDRLSSPFRLPHRKSTVDRTQSLFLYFQALGSQGLTDDERCAATWGILWPWAKKGNVEARERLYFHTLMTPHNDVIRLPGSHGDFASRLHDALILGVHSSGTEYKKEIYTDLLQGFVAVGLEKTKFCNCIKENYSSDCSRVAVEEGLVPSFEHFAKNVDLFLEQGRAQQYFYHHEAE